VVNKEDANMREEAMPVEELLNEAKQLDLALRDQDGPLPARFRPILEALAEHLHGLRFEDPGG
jgi:hypothetical protein